MAGSVTGKTALITGAARGLGRAMALGLAKAGYGVAACDLPSSTAELTSLADAVGGNQGQLLPVSCDVTDIEQCRAAVHAANASFGTVDILVNDAGIGMESITRQVHNNPFKFFEIEESFWRRTFDVNTLGTFHMTKLVVPGQIARGWGRIINVTTSLPTMLKAGFSPYGPSKAAIEAASAIWSKELVDTGVTVNVLVPGGSANTRMIPLEDVPIRELLVQPESMVPPLLWLISVSADRVTGRRYQAKLWQADLPVEQAERLAGADVAWQ